jgi:hypothetical protein
VVLRGVRALKSGPLAEGYRATTGFNGFCAWIMLSVPRPLRMGI